MKKILLLSLLFLAGWAFTAQAIDLDKENRDPEYVESIVKRSQKIVDKLGINDAKVAEDVRNVIANRYFTLNDIYEVRDAKVKEIKELGSHHMFLADVLAVHADPEYMDEKKKFHLNDAKPLVYSHGEYLGIGKKLGTFGYSVKKKKKSSGKKR